MFFAKAQPEAEEAFKDLNISLSGSTGNRTSVINNKYCLS